MIARDRRIAPPNSAGGGFVWLVGRHTRRLLHVNSAERKLLPENHPAHGGVVDLQSASIADAGADPGSVGTRLDVELTDKQKTLAEHEAKATDTASDATARQRANDAIVAQTPYLSALEQVRLKVGECFQVLLVEPLAKHTHNAFDSTLDYAVRDYADRGSMKLRGQVCNGFRAESSLIYIAKRITGIKGADAWVTSFLGSNLLSMPLSEMFLKLTPIFVLSKPKLVAATTDVDSIAAQFSTTELMKTKLHLVAGESIVNTDGENHHHGYDQLAKENITTESTDVYSIAHPFGADEATKHAWIRAFYEVSNESGLTVAVEFTAETFFIRELGVVAVGEATTGVWGMDNCLCAANEAVKHTGLKVQPWDLQTTPQVNDRSGPRPSALAKMVASNNLMSNIKRWEKPLLVFNFMNFVFIARDHMRMYSMATRPWICISTTKKACERSLVADGEKKISEFRPNLLKF